MIDGREPANNVNVSSAYLLSSPPVSPSTDLRTSSELASPPLQPSNPGDPDPVPLRPLGQRGRRPPASTSDFESSELEPETDPDCRTRPSSHSREPKFEPVSHSLLARVEVPTLTSSSTTTAPIEHGVDADVTIDQRRSSCSRPARTESDCPMRSKPSLLRSSGRKVSYGSLSQATGHDASPSESESQSGDTHLLRDVSTTRSESSRGNTLSRQTSRISEDLDTAALGNGPESRFGVGHIAMPSDAFRDFKSDAGDEDEDLYPGYDYDYADSDRGDEPSLDDSPHDIVRASVPPSDNITLSINTPRMWTLSILFSILGSSTNLFFSLRYPSVSITPVIALLLVHPLGLLWDYLFKRPTDPPQEFIDGLRASPASPHPERRTMGSRLRLWLAQGRWNKKEHTCVYVSSNVSFGFAFATDVIVEQTKFYNQEATIPYQVLLTLSTQTLGYAFAGLARRFLVRPGGMVWPGTLMSAAMFSTLHKEENKPANGWTISRWKFFYFVFGSAFTFYFLPGLLMPCLSYFNVVTWFAPKNVVVANLFGVVSGLGLFPMTFDWAQVTYIGSPLLVPFWAAVNVVGGLFVVMWLIAPIAYYLNLFYSSYIPIISAAVFDNTGSVYNVTKILTDDFLFDRESYKEYSRVFLPITYVLSYGLQFAGLAALLTHTACWHGKEIWETGRTAWREARDEGKASYQPLSTQEGPGGTGRPGSAGSFSRGSQAPPSRLEGHLLFNEDVHYRLMKRYKDAPMTWYLLTFVIMLAIGIFVVEYYPIHLPWYGLLLALAICAIFFIPNGIIMAVTNQHSSIYLICQLICGAVFPGRPIANMVFVTYGYISSAQGIKFASDLKLGHYMKIPPRIMFTVQMAATIVSSVTQIVVLNWMFANVSGLCTSEAVNGFTCPLARVHFNGSVLWGVVGPEEFFGPNATYRSLVWFFLLGAVLPIPLWMYSRDRKNSIVRKVNLPLMFGSMSWIPPATGLNFSVWALVCYIFNYHVKRRAGAWWSKYTMTMSAALDSGLALGIIVVFFGFIYPGVVDSFRWWGTEVYKQGCDWQACPYKTVPEGGHFGPDTW